MDLNKLIEKSEKYIHKDLKFSMKEFKILKEFKKDVEDIEQLLNQQPDHVEVENLLEFYKAKARTCNRYSESIVRRLNRWIKKLERVLSAEELELSIQDRRYFEQFKLKLRVCQNSIIKKLAYGGDIHDLIEKEDWKAVELKIDEALGDNRNPE